MDFPSFSFSLSAWPSLARLRLPALTIAGRTASLPVVQGGMGVGISLSGLAVAVAEQGGIGVIAANAIGMIDAHYHQDPIAANVRALRAELRRARERTDGLIGVNIMVAVDCFHELLEVCAEERADLVFLGAGLPIHNIPVARLRAAGVGVVPIVSSARAARVIFRSWEKQYHDLPDGVVVEGPLAGGHLGFKVEDLGNPACALEAVVPAVVAELEKFEVSSGRRLPVIAAGGIWDGADIDRFLRLGASGVQLGTRFVATDECDADDRFKQSYVACRREDIVIIKSPVGLPGRAIANSFLADVAAGVAKRFRCPARCLESCGAREARYCISEALDNARRGELDQGFAFCGANAHRVDRVMPVAELVDGLRKGYAWAVGTAMVREECARTQERLGAMKEEYSRALADNLAAMKEDYSRSLAEYLDAMREEYERVRERCVAEWNGQAELQAQLARLKAEYDAALLRAQAARDEIVAYFAEPELT